VQGSDPNIAVVDGRAARLERAFEVVVSHEQVAEREPDDRVIGDRVAELLDKADRILESIRAPATCSSPARRMTC
jgi:hypothetical protein